MLPTSRSRVRLLGKALGVRWKNVRGGRLENVIVADAPVGISLTRVTGVAVVNCTIANASSIGLSLVDVEDAAVFNNVIAEAGTGVMLGGSRRGLHLDYNLYRALFAGKVDGQSARVSLGPWRDVTGGLDAHSVNLPVRFAAAERAISDRFRVLDWDPSRATTADWGVTESAASRRPRPTSTAPRAGAFDVGAYEAPPSRPPGPMAHFTIADDEGTKSAGIFRPDGTLVRYCSTTCRSRRAPTASAASPHATRRPSPPGKYEVRVVESRLGWDYREMTGNDGIAAASEDTDQNHVIVRPLCRRWRLAARQWLERTRRKPPQPRPQDRQGQLGLQWHRRHARPVRRRRQDDLLLRPPAEGYLRALPHRPGHGQAGPLGGPETGDVVLPGAGLEASKNWTACFTSPT